MRIVSSLILALTLLATSFAYPALADEGNSVGVCCAWNDKLSDRVLTYKISGGDDAARQAVREAVEEWDAALAGLELTEVFGKTKADINVKFKTGGGQIQGMALRKFDSSGFVSSVDLTISGSAFGNPNNVNTVKQITKHEMGHALGLGHANFNGDLMSTTVSGGSETISACDVNGVLEANHWKLVDGFDAPHIPHVDHVHCP